jgi:hypothetical protein
LLVCLYPIETGYWLADSNNNATLEGPMAANGVSGCQAFGAYIGNLLKSEPNIYWAEGNDYNYGATGTTGDSLVQAVRTGIISANPVSTIGTIEGTSSNWYPNGTWTAYGTGVSSDCAAWTNEIQGNWAYIFTPSYAWAHKYWIGTGVPNAPTPKTPYIMGESTYELDTFAVAGTPLNLRKVNWCSLCYGGLGGSFFGSNYVWTFPSGWASNLQSPGALQAGYAGQFFNNLPRQNLVPDFGHTIVTSGYGTEFTNLNAQPTTSAYIANDTFVPVSATASGVVRMSWRSGMTRQTTAIRRSEPTRRERARPTRLLRV